MWSPIIIGVLIVVALYVFDRAWLMREIRKVEEKLHLVAAKPTFVVPVPVPPPAPPKT